jgi:hypothetical protein
MNRKYVYTLEIGCDDPHRMLEVMHELVGTDVQLRILEMIDVTPEPVCDARVAAE